MTENGAIPTKPKKSKGDPTQREIDAWAEAHKFRYVTIAVSDDVKERIKDHATTEADICAFMLDVTTARYKLSINWDNKHSCMVVSITDSSFWRDTYNACVTSRGPELWIALAMAIHKWNTVISISGIPIKRSSDESILD